MKKPWLIALAGNPNVGKSTVFNSLTGLHQHTGNWPGKTVASAQGEYTFRGEKYRLIDLPGAYSLAAHSAEEEIARDFLCFQQPDACIVVCDATRLARSLNLVLQIRELCPRTVVCLNLMDEARKKGIVIHIRRLEKELGLPVIPTAARKKEGLRALTAAVEHACRHSRETPAPAVCPPGAERAVAVMEPVLREQGAVFPRWAALRLLEGDDSLRDAMEKAWGIGGVPLERALTLAKRELERSGLSPEKLADQTVSCLSAEADRICATAKTGSGLSVRDRRLDRLLTGKWTGIPIMLLLLAAVLWITIAGANYPSQWLSAGFAWIGARLEEGLLLLGAPEPLRNVLLQGIWQVLSWVVAVMLPPMAIFFPLFTLLEDLGYLPRIAFTLDHCFQKAKACGKQALTMCMGFGCNAVGVSGCRIIDSPRERLLAMVTNSFVPCNGRFPLLISMITLFFAGAVGGLWGSALSALLLTGLLLLGVLMTFWVSRLLSATVLKGMPSSFTLELPPYRRPQVGQVLLRSILDRTLFVLGRAVSIAAPAGLLLWCMANLTLGGETLLALCAGALDPFARILGLDGVILLAFILGSPANEIVVPIIIMAYMAQGHLMELELPALGQLLRANGWSWCTALCTMLFSLMHWPCTTTLLTIRKESGSWKWAALAAVVPTLCGMVLCAAVAFLARLAGIG